MMDDATETIVALVTAFIGVAILAILVSKNSATVGVIGAAAGGFSQILGVAISPVMGAPYAGTGASGQGQFAGGNNNGVGGLPSGIIQNLAGAIPSLLGN